MQPAPSNRSAQVPINLFKLSNLSCLVLSGNEHLSTPPQDVVHQLMSAVDGYESEESRQGIANTFHWLESVSRAAEIIEHEATELSLPSLRLTCCPSWEVM